VLNLLQAAEEAGAEVIATECPTCHSGLEMHQIRAETHFGITTRVCFPGVFFGGRDMPRCSVILLALALVAACDSRPKEPPPDLIKSQRQAMEKAKGTEAVIDQAATERLKKAEQGSQ